MKKSCNICAPDAKFARITLFALALFCMTLTLFAAEGNLVILHTNDMHSHLDGYGPFMDYTPSLADNDTVTGGIARVATLIKNERSSSDAVLALDAGDFSQGSLYHTVFREQALELQLMKTAGIDFATLGNHEFDFKPSGLASMLRAAEKNGMPQLICSNVVFNSSDERDDSAKAAFKDGLVKSYVVKEIGGLRVGIFALLGYNAAEVSPYAEPITFTDHQLVAKEMVAKLRNEEKVDVVICISHIGLDENDISKGEVITLAQKVSGIDIIVDGHSHTELESPITVNNTLIVQTGSYTRSLGRMEIAVKNGKTSLVSYALLPVDDHTPGDSEMIAAVDKARASINSGFLAANNLRYDQVIAETSFDLTADARSSNLGDIVSDAMLWKVNQCEDDRALISFEGDGLVRDNLPMGVSGNLTAADIFRVLPLGFDPLDDSIGYPLVSFYLTGREIKIACEVLTTATEIKGPDYYLHFSGIKMRYNPKRMLFDRVVELSLNDEGIITPIDISYNNNRLYKVVANTYNVTYFGRLGSMTKGLFKFEPKTKDGTVIADITTAIVDSDKNTPGIQGVKEWAALMEYFKSFEDTNGNGIPNVSSSYSAPQERVIRDSGMNPISLLQNATWPTWTVVGLISLVCIALIILVRRCFSKKKNK